MISSSHLVSLSFLFVSSCFMVVAWYAHLKFKTFPLWQAIFASWLLAFFEYCFQVPANRIGHQVMSAAQLRIVAEFFTMLAFFGFSVWYLKEPFKTNYYLSFALMFAAVYVAFWGPFKD